MVKTFFFRKIDFFCKNGNLEKHIVLVNLGLRKYQNRIQYVHKSAHAKYELCSCPERRVMTILRPPGPKIMQNMSFVVARSLPGACQGLPGAARGCQELPGAARSCQERPPGGKNPRTIGSCESKVACNFFIVFRVFECLICNLF